MAVSQNLYLTQLSQNIASNSSTVRITLTSTQEGSSWNGYDRTGYYYISINGGGESAYSFTTTLPKNSTITCFSTDVTVPHRADGTGSISVRTSLDTGIAAGTVTTSNAITLTTIPRTSVPTLSAGAVEFGQNITIYTNRAASSFNHLLYYSINGSDDVMLGWVEDNFTWTVPLSLMNNIPSATAATITFRLYTFADSTSIGSNAVSFTASVPASVIPSIGGVAVSDPTGGLGKYGAYVQYKSKAYVEVLTSGTYSSTISSLKVEANNKTYTAAPVETGTLNNAGTQAITVTVVDSRGRTNSKTVYIDVLAYMQPSITLMNGIRCNADGTFNAEGAYAKISMAGAITSLNSKNAKSFRLEYKETSSPTWTELQTYSVYSLNENKIVACNTDKSYDFRLVATDDFTSTTYANKIDTIYVLIDYRSTGKGISFGKVSEKDAFECALPAEFKSVKTVNGADLDDIIPKYITYTASNCTASLFSYKIGKMLILHGVIIPNNKNENFTIYFDGISLKNIDFGVVNYGGWTYDVQTMITMVSNNNYITKSGALSQPYIRIDTVIPLN